MAPFETIKTLEFTFQDQNVRWQLHITPCFSFIRCNHPLFIKRFGHANIIVRNFDSMFENISEEDDDFFFLLALNQSARTYPLNDLETN